MEENACTKMRWRESKSGEMLQHMNGGGKEYSRGIDPSGIINGNGSQYRLIATEKRSVE